MAAETRARSAGSSEVKANTRVIMLALLAMPCLASAGEAPLASLPRHVALDPHRHVSGQPSAEAIGQLRSAGITTVIDLRPDQETPELDEKSVAEKAGLKYRTLPIAGAADLTRENVLRFDQLLKETASENTLIHCASGNRVGAMLALQARWLQGKSAEESLAIGKAAGMTSLAADVQKLVEATPQSSPAR
jgi:uncharacterized protein (TIGR01244 family)